jgi:hypothetical protein
MCDTAGYDPVLLLGVDDCDERGHERYWQPSNLDPAKWGYDKNRVPLYISHF